MDKFHVCQGISGWVETTELHIVDMITWNKDKMGMGYRTRRFCEYLLVIQKSPKRAKGVWNIHNIPDFYTEKVTRKEHTHQNPLDLQSMLIKAVIKENDIVIDPSAGSFSVMDACINTKRTFLGCDIVV